jgi:hypothetical protein
VSGTEKEISEIDSQFVRNHHKAPPEFFLGALLHGIVGLIPSADLISFRFHFTSGYK